MTTSVGQDLVKHLWKTAVVSGVLAVIVGAVVLIWPQVTLLVAAYAFGAYLLISGIAQVVFAFTLPVSSAGMRVLLFLTGAISFVLGVLCFKDELNSILLLAIWIGVGWIAQGIAGTITAIGDKDLPGRGWQIFSGVISTIAGIVLIVYPISSIVTLTLVVGIWLIVIGVLQIGSGIGIRSATKSSA
ncbi:acid-resistance membrane protein [Mycobacteroides salmoniphilum]|uniref:Acid-resistance membrane protein n=1 Tax=Mycobacteroides salmoniphilum TaxID=404941 RepID=A0A4R8S0L6_9MYCO|nr:HdeD family acid-resistance protein [Mycobacteroides salmoniphilum]TDZ76802.1 acid-resistance membrane protein [Mycobacteroides salmoniphilum]TDZ82721.1 acid-resistance membrane protein [Mycobacteroides salmoniphilum]TDZ86962.1 acid-resistance membrane protein [Mycobacteroides salmoniphilum]